MAAAETLPPTAEIPDPNAAPHEAGPHPHAGGSEIRFAPHMDIEATDLLIVQGYEASDPNRDAVTEERARMIEDTVRTDGERRGFDDMDGLSMTLGDGRRFVVRGQVSMQQERRTEVVTTGRPRFHGERGGFETFGRKEEPRRIRKTWSLRPTFHIPGTNTPDVDGSLVGLDRREVGLNPKFQDKPMILIEEYDEMGDLVRVDSQRLSKLQDIWRLAGEHGVAEADWQERREKGDQQVIPVALPGYASRERLSTEKDAPSVAQTITSQLEEQGIRNWEGLYWRRRTPAQPGQRDASYTTQEIISDSTVKGVRFEGFEWSRSFIVRTTQATDNGIIIHDKKMKDSELFHYLESGARDLTFSEMRLIRDKPDGEAADLRPHNPEDRSVGEWASTPGDKESVALDEAFELMSYQRVYELLLGDEKGAHALKERVEALKNNKHERELAEELQRTIAEVGMDRFKEVVQGMQEEYVEDVRRLNLKQSAWDYYSPSLMIRDLMKKRLENRQANQAGTEGDLWDPLSQGFEARRFREGLVDLYMGRRFGKTVTKVGRPMPVPTGKVDSETGRPEHKEKREYQFDDEIFHVPSVVDGPMTKAKQKRGKTWDPIEKQAHRVFDMLTAVPHDDDEKNPYIEDGSLAAEERKLGRMLRRTIPPQAWHRHMRFS